MPVKTSAIGSALNIMFAAPLAVGELEFLGRRVLNVLVSDAGLRFSVRLERNRLHVDSEAAVADITIEGTLYTFLLLATRKEDADTLFFRRQLKTSGDTELGLYIKNFLDGLDADKVPFHRIIHPVLCKSVLFAEHFARLQARK